MPELPSHLRNVYREVYVPYTSTSRAGIEYTKHKRRLQKLEYKPVKKELGVKR